MPLSFGELAYACISQLWPGETFAGFVRLRLHSCQVPYVLWRLICRKQFRHTLVVPKVSFLVGLAPNGEMLSLVSPWSFGIPWVTGEDYQWPVCLLLTRRNLYDLSINIIAIRRARVWQNL